MAEETIIKDENTLDTDYIKVIQELKENTVGKDEYDKLRLEHKKLIDAYVEGKEYEGLGGNTEETPVDIAALNDSMASGELTNLQYAEASLAQRKALIENGEKDPYLPWGDKIIPTDEDMDAANRVAEALEHCIEYAEGDSQAFTNELQRIMVDAAPTIRPRKR